MGAVSSAPHAHPIATLSGVIMKVAMNEPLSEPSVLVEEFHLGAEGRGADASAVAVLVTLSRPDSLNAIDSDMLRQLHSVIDGVGRRDDVCCVLLTGAGRAFSAGGISKATWRCSATPARSPASWLTSIECSGVFVTCRSPWSAWSMG